MKTRYEEMTNFHGEAQQTRKSDANHALILYDEGIKIAREINSKEHEGDYMLDKSTLLFELGRYDEAAECSKSGADVTRGIEGYTYSNAKIFQGICLYRFGRQTNNKQSYHDAIGCFDEIINSNSIYPYEARARAYKNKGNTLSLLERYPEALACYEEAIRLYPLYLAAFTNKGNAFYALEKYKAAQKSYEDALRILDTKSSSEIKNLSDIKITTYLHLAMSKFNNGDTNGALKELDNTELSDNKLTPSLVASKYNCRGLCNYR